MTVYEGNVEKFRAYCDKQTFDQIVDYGTVQQLLQHSTDAYAQRTAVSDEAETTFSELGADAAVLRGALRDAGVSKGDLVGILLPNSYDAVKAFFATVTAGAVAVEGHHNFRRIGTQDGACKEHKAFSGYRQSRPKRTALRHDRRRTF